MAVETAKVEEVAAEPRRDASVRARGEVGSRVVGVGRVHPLLALQRSAGNRAVSVLAARALQRKEATGPPPGQQWNDSSESSSSSVHAPGLESNTKEGTLGDGTTYRRSDTTTGGNTARSETLTYTDGYAKTTTTTQGPGGPRTTTTWTKNGEPVDGKGPGGAPAGSYASARNQLQSLHALGFASRGRLVRELQERLADHGHPVKVDGEYGHATERAVKDFQSSATLHVDGVCGMKTWHALGGTGQLPTLGQQQRGATSGWADTHTADDLTVGPDGMTKTHRVDTADSHELTTDSVHTNKGGGVTTSHSTTRSDGHGFSSSSQTATTDGHGGFSFDERSLVASKNGVEVHEHTRGSAGGVLTVSDRSAVFDGNGTRITENSTIVAGHTLIVRQQSVESGSGGSYEHDATSVTGPGGSATTTHAASNDATGHHETGAGVYSQKGGPITIVKTGTDSNGQKETQVATATPSGDGTYTVTEVRTYHYGKDGKPQLDPIIVEV